jgi:hypothetical protein
MKLPQLQQIAKLAGIKHYGLKKEALIELILKIQDDQPIQSQNNEKEEETSSKPKRNRIRKTQQNRSLNWMSLLIHPF